MSKVTEGHSEHIRKISSVIKVILGLIKVTDAHSDHI